MSAEQVIGNMFVALSSACIAGLAVKLLVIWRRRQSGEPFLTFLETRSTRRKLLFQFLLVTSGLAGAGAWLWIICSLSRDSRPLLEFGLLEAHTVDKVFGGLLASQLWLQSLVPAGTRTSASRQDQEPYLFRLFLLNCALMLSLVVFFGR